MAKLNEIIDFCNTVLSIDDYKDSSLNGLQVEGSQDIESIAVSVDSGLSIIEKIQRNQLLLVHHGLFWKNPLPITGILKNKIEILLDSNSSLAAYHLPLDGHQVFGNAAQIFQKLNLKYEPGFLFEGMPIGAISKNLAIKREDILSKLNEISLEYNFNPLHLNFGKEIITSIGICTGSAAKILQEAIDLKLDLYITGEPNQSAYHLSKENNINASFIGHYASETFGVISLAELICQQFNLEYLFINEPTGI